jgi:hypothetical protein
MHVQDKRAFEKLPLLQAKIDACAAFALEFHLEEIHAQPPACTPYSDKGKPLSELIPKSKFDKLCKVVRKAARFDIGQFPNASPLFLVNLIGLSFLHREMPYSLDEYLWQYAKTKEKPLFGLETFASQLAVMAKIPVNQQVKMLLDTVRHIGAYRRHVLHLTQLFQEEDLAGIHKTVKRQSGGMRKIMLYDRNLEMAGRIEELARQHPTFFAIGAGHLSGGKGIIRLLKTKGFKVSPVSFEDRTSSNL